MRRVLAMLALTTFLSGHASALTYHMALDERTPLQASVSVDLPPDRTADLTLGIRPRSAPSMAGAPDCDGAPLAAQAPTRWTVPAACHTIHWTLALRDQDKQGMDAADPTGAWSAAGDWWLLTDHLAFLAPPGGWDSAQVEMVARLRDGRIVKIATPFPGRGQMPFYGVVSGKPPRLYRSGGFALRVHGAVPAEAGDAQQQFFADTWSRWRRDVLPVKTVTPASLDILWIAPPPHADPGFMASAGMRAVLMQNIPGPDKAASDAKLRAAALLGVHEGFHTLIDRSRRPGRNGSMKAGRAILRGVRASIASIPPRSRWRRS